MEAYATGLISRLVDARNIQPQTAKTYAINLKVIRKIVDPLLKNDEWYTQHIRIIKAIANSPATTRMTRLNSLLVLSELEGNLKYSDIYRKYYADERATYKVWVSTQTKSPSQARRWTSADELREVRDKLLTRAAVLFHQDELSSAEFAEYQKAIAFGLYVAYPLRNVYGDMTIIRLKKFDKLSPAAQAAKNFYVYTASKSFIHLAKYKTSKTFGIRRIPMSDTIHAMLINWLTINPTNSLFVSKRQGSIILTPMNPQSFGKLIARISKENLGRGTTTTDIRHILISELNEGKPSIQEEKEESEAIQDKFLHSVEMNKSYRKLK
jgi:hypothetical protein